MIPIIMTGLAYVGKFLLYLLKNPRIVAITTVGLAVAFLYFQLQLANKDVIKLQYENNNLKTSVQVLEVEKQTRITNDIILTERIAKQEALVKSLEEAISNIDSAPESDDGPVAPILKRAIEGN
jgi:hypothetical protein